MGEWEGLDGQSRGVSYSGYWILHGQIMILTIDGNDINFQQNESDILLASGRDYVIDGEGFTGRIVSNKKIEFSDGDVWIKTSDEVRMQDHLGIKIE